MGGRMLLPKTKRFMNWRPDIWNKKAFKISCVLKNNQTFYLILQNKVRFYSKRQVLAVSNQPSSCPSQNITMDRGTVFTAVSD